MNSAGLSLFENLIFLTIATSFLAIVGRIWRHSKPFSLPEFMPNWFQVWFGTVLTIGIGLPLIALIWSVWQGESRVWSVLIPYFMLLGLQILTESVILRWFHSIVWVMVPYLYLPYRLWQVYQSLLFFKSEGDLLWFQNLLTVEIVLWTANYGFNLLLLPKLLRWETNEV
jgi:hypothetical protein